VQRTTPWISHKGNLEINTADAVLKSLTLNLKVMQNGGAASAVNHQQ